MNQLGIYRCCDLAKTEGLPVGCESLELSSHLRANVKRRPDLDVALKDHPCGGPFIAGSRSDCCRLRRVHARGERPLPTKRLAPAAGICRDLRVQDSHDNTRFAAPGNTSLRGFYGKRSVKRNFIHASSPYAAWPLKGSGMSQLLECKLYCMRHFACNNNQNK